MFKNILIIGCGMIGSSILRGVISQKLCKKAYVYEKNIKYQNQIKKINKKIILIKKLDKKIKDMDLVVISTPMSEYQKIIIKLNKNLNNKTLITDFWSTRWTVAKLIKEEAKKSKILTDIYVNSDCDEIGKHVRFRFWCLFGLRVRVSPSVLFFLLS